MVVGKPPTRALIICCFTGVENTPEGHGKIVLGSLFQTACIICSLADLLQLTIHSIALILSLTLMTSTLMRVRWKLSHLIFRSFNTLAGQHPYDNKAEEAGRYARCPGQMSGSGHYFQRNKIPYMCLAACKWKYVIIYSNI